MKPQRLLFIACLLAGISFVNAQNIYYVTQNGAGAKDGTDWADAYDTVAFRSLLKTANYGTTYWLASGTYTPGNGRDSSFLVPSGVKLYGGFPTTGNPTFADRNITLNPTILSGEIGTSQVTDNCYHVVQLKYADSTTILDGLTISDGYSATNGSDANGAGIYNDGSNSSLVGSSPLIVNCTFKNNLSYNGWGGAIYNDGYNGKSESKIVNCSFTGNWAQRGGAIYNDGQTGECRAQISNCTFARNVASIFGSAIFNTGTYSGYNFSNITNCLFIHNFAGNQGTIGNDGQSASGNEGCFINVTNCTFDQDSASSGGASIIYNYTYNANFNCVANLTNCIIWNNTMPLIFNYTGGYNTVTYVNYSDVQGGYTGTNNIAIDPMFIDYPNDNYMIASCSPCVNSGTDSLAPNMDIDSTFRPIKGKYDMGAYESKDTGIIAADIALTITPGDTFCSNTNAVFTATSHTPTPSYRWQVNGVTTGTSSPTFVSSTLNTGDVVTCKVVSTASCLSPNNAIDSIRVFVKPASTAGFTYNNNGNNYSFTNSSTDATNIEWLFGDGDSSAASNPSHTYTGTGNYVAMLVSYNDCGSDTARQTIHLSTGIQNVADEKINIYPNPSFDKLYVDCTGLNPESIAIYNVAGQKVSSLTYNPIIDVSLLSSGIYFIEIQTRDNNFREKFTKQ